MALKGLQLAERDFERGTLDEENLKRINSTVKEIMEDLADFEPRRWFRKMGPVEKKQDAEEAQTGLASLSTMDEAEEEPLPILNLPNSRRAGKRRAQSFASVAERPSMRQPLLCLPVYLTSMA